MNILFYIEQYPIRESKLQHAWLIRQLEVMLRDEFFHKRQMSYGCDFRVVLNKAQKKEFPPKSPVQSSFVLSLSEAEEEELETLILPWDVQGLHRWKKVLEGEGRASDFCYSLLSRLKSDYDFDVIVYCGMNGAVKRFAQEYDIPALAVDLGCTREPFLPTMLLDYQGVNGLSYPVSLPLEETRVKHSLEDLKIFMPFVSPVHKGVEDLCNAVHIKLPLLKEVLKAPQKNVLIALQLKDEPSIIAQSPYTSMIEMLEDIVPALLEKGYRCFIKPHPRAKGLGVRKMNRDDHLYCKHYCKDFENVFWIEDEMIENSLSLIQKMSAVISINSSVGFEAMVLGKAVVTLGQAVYKKEGMSLSMKDFLEETYDRKRLHEDSEKIVNYLLFSYLIPKDKFFDYSQFCKFVERAVLLREEQSLDQVFWISQNDPTWVLGEQVSMHREKQKRLERQKKIAQEKKKT